MLLLLGEHAFYSILVCMDPDPRQIFVSMSIECLLRASCDRPENKKQQQAGWEALARERPNYKDVLRPAQSAHPAKFTTPFLL